MSTVEDRLAVIQNIYTEALNNEAKDLSAATTPALVAAIQANLANARATYYAAAEAALDSSAPAVELAYASADSALNRVKAARVASESIESLLNKLSTATNAGVSLLGVAKTA